MPDLSALALTCSLTSSPEPSSSELIARQLLDELAQHGVRTSSVRVVDHDVKPGVAVDMGDGDAADLAQGLNDVGFTLPAQGATYWVGEAMGSTDYQELEQVPEAVASTTATAARNAAHLARLLRGTPYPAVG